MAISERARVLITVKASPEPSTSYGDTVCVAGIRLDREQPEWIRLYPVPFRYLEAEQKFKKYDILTMDIVKATKDPRRESHTPARSSIQFDSHLPVNQRANVVLPLVDRSMCEVVKDLDTDINGPSLAIVRARQIVRMVVEPHPGWTDDEKRRIAAWGSQPDLLQDGPHIRTIEAPRFRASYEWFCETESCNRHTQRLLDWELTAFQRRFAKDTDEQLKARIDSQFLDRMFSKGRFPFFYVGNFASGPKRKSFSILGTFPSTQETAHTALF
jgi:hypothetical protein